ncbi:MAG: hypothetical protein AB4911_11145 [Oscillochloridaceae bacterium umkhey_bin13]
MQPLSSARPEDLATYARAGHAAGARLEAEARHLDAALSPFFVRCCEYAVPQAHGLVPRLNTYGSHEATLATEVAQVMAAFRQADQCSAFGPCLSPMPPGQAQPNPQTERWNREALALMGALRTLRVLIRLQGLYPVLASPLFRNLILPILLAHGGAVGLLAVANGRSPQSDLAATEPFDQLQIVLQTFWYESMRHLEPAVFRQLAAELDALNLLVAQQQARAEGTPRRHDQLEPLRDPRGPIREVSARQAFPFSAPCADGPLAPFYPSAVDAMAGDHSGISYFPREQVRLERLNAANEFRLSIAGLDTKKPAATNNLEAVALTAQGVRDGNHYYAEVRARFLAELARIPPGSVLHLQGHSMGGGMCFLLRGDPVVVERLNEAQITIGSVITFGAVRPQGLPGRPVALPASPFANALERNYVNSDDSLARNVGGGHAGDPTVIMLENWQIDDPAVAHNGYDQPANYHDLPNELLVMPYLVDPASYQVYAPAAAAISWAKLEPTPTP